MTSIKEKDKTKLNPGDQIFFEMGLDLDER